MPGPIRKDPERRQNRTTRDLGLVSAAPPAVPDPPTGLLKATRDRWAAFWGSQAASLVMPADLPALERLFQLLDERTRCQKAAASEGRLVLGSQGQQVLSPLYKHIAVIDSEIRQLEDRFGLSPMARLKLGVTFGEAHRSLADLNDDLEGDDVDDSDPRAGWTVIDGSALA